MNKNLDNLIKLGQQKNLNKEEELFLEENLNQLNDEQKLYFYSFFSKNKTYNKKILKNLNIYFSYLLFETNNFLSINQFNEDFVFEKISEVNFGNKLILYYYKTNNSEHKNIIEQLILKFLSNEKDAASTDINYKYINLIPNQIFDEYILNNSNCEHFLNVRLPEKNIFQKKLEIVFNNDKKYGYMFLSKIFFHNKNNRNHPNFLDCINVCIDFYIKNLKTYIDIYKLNNFKNSQEKLSAEAALAENFYHLKHFYLFTNKFVFFDIFINNENFFNQLYNIFDKLKFTIYKPDSSENLFINKNILFNTFLGFKSKEDYLINFLQNIDFKNDLHINFLKLFFDNKIVYNKKIIGDSFFLDLLNDKSLMSENKLKQELKKTYYNFLLNSPLNIKEIINKDHIFEEFFTILITELDFKEKDKLQNLLFYEVLQNMNKQQIKKLQNFITEQIKEHIENNSYQTIISLIEKQYLSTIDVENKNNNQIKFKI